MWWIAVWSCKKDAEEMPKPEPSTTVTTGDVQQADCAQTDNPLRFLCTLDVGVPAEALWTVYEGETAIRTFTSGSDTHHEVALWGLPPETALRWEAVTSSGTSSGTASGAVTTGALPASIAALSLQTTGLAEQADHFMVPYTCGGETGVVLLGTDGVVRWYEPVSVRPPNSGVFIPSAGITSAEWLGNDEIVMTIDGERAARLTAGGQWLYDVDGFDRPLHHDLTAVGDYVYIINASQQGDLVVDGMYVLDTTGAVVATWDLADHVTVTGPGSGGFWSTVFPGASDFAHTNGLSADGPDHLLMSLRLFDAVVRLVADPADPSFGEIEWALTGNDNAIVQSDFVWTDGGSFEGQHHPSPLGSDSATGGIAVFDNAPDNEDSRALFLDIDPVSGTVSERASWSVGRHCSIQGGAYELQGGGALATCQDISMVYEFVPDNPAPVWTGKLTCDGGSPGRIDRARPVFLR